MALVSSLDAVALFVLVIVLLLALDDFENYDFFLLCAHLLHLFTVGLSYMVVRHTTTSLDTLRILIVVYAVILIVDVAVVIGRVILLGHEREEHRHRHMNEFLRVVLALGFCVIDCAGLLFTNVAQHSLHALCYTNEQFAGLADIAFYKATPPNTAPL